ncbi:MAG: hypothetical protein MOB07_14700 [Acidobacteria bacterium]|nr:hypothetical protein [Acidobacteriota bacterium]
MRIHGGAKGWPRQSSRVFGFGAFRRVVLGWRCRLQEARSDEFLCEGVDVFLVALSADAGGNDQDDDAVIVYSVYNAVALADGAEFDESI